MKTWRFISIILIVACGFFYAGYNYAFYLDIPQFAKDACRKYSYLAIGNSITIHPIVEYWWAESGMAASKPERDYYHIVVNNLEKRYGKSMHVHIIIIFGK